VDFLDTRYLIQIFHYLCFIAYLTVNQCIRHTQIGYLLIEKLESVADPRTRLENPGSRIRLAEHDIYLPATIYPTSRIPSPH